MIPCKDCIAFAVCNSHDDKITCSILYKYFIEGGFNIIQKDGGSYYKSDRLQEIPKFFKRKLGSWYTSSNEKFSFDNDPQTITFKWDKLKNGEFMKL